MWPGSVPKSNVVLLVGGGAARPSKTFVRIQQLELAAEFIKLPLSRSGKISFKNFSLCIMILMITKT